MWPDAGRSKSRFRNLKEIAVGPASPSFSQVFSANSLEFLHLRPQF
jgi:hypothetical protein